jgi:hypothetical protein
LLAWGKKDAQASRTAIPILVNIDHFVPLILPDRKSNCIIHYMRCHICV